jgi:hypothetical protein
MIEPDSSDIKRIIERCAVDENGVPNRNRLVDLSKTVRDRKNLRLAEALRLPRRSLSDVLARIGDLYGRSWGAVVAGAAPCADKRIRDDRCSVLAIRLELIVRDVIGAS